MKNIFKLQRICFYLFIVIMVVNFIFSLSFMTDYDDLFGFELEANKSIKIFHDNMQAFNKVIFYLSLVGAIAIAVVFILELNHKVPDRFAIIVISAIALVLAFQAIYSFIKFGSLMNEYKNVNYSYMWLENSKLDADYVYEPKHLIFYLGYVVNALVLLISIAFPSVLLISHKDYIKQGKEEAVLNA